MVSSSEIVSHYQLSIVNYQLLIINYQLSIVHYQLILRDPRETVLKINLAKKMKRIVNISKNFKDADEWDISQHIKLTSEERQKIAKILKIKFYGKKNKDVRESMR